MNYNDIWKFSVFETSHRDYKMKTSSVDGQRTHRLETRGNGRRKGFVAALGRACMLILRWSRWKRGGMPLHTEQAFLGSTSGHTQIPLAQGTQTLPLRPRPSEEAQSGARKQDKSRPPVPVPRRAQKGSLGRCQGVSFPRQSGSCLPLVSLGPTALESYPLLSRSHPITC